MNYREKYSGFVPEVFSTCWAEKLQILNTSTISAEVGFILVGDAQQKNSEVSFTFVVKGKNNNEYFCYIHVAY